MNSEASFVCICGLSGVSHRCAKCRSAYYCSKECQRADWSNHKYHCRRSEVGRVDVSQGQLRDTVQGSRLGAVAEVAGGGGGSSSSGIRSDAKVGETSCHTDTQQPTAGLFTGEGHVDVQVPAVAKVATGQPSLHDVATLSQSLAGSRERRDSISASDEPVDSLAAEGLSSEACAQVTSPSTVEWSSFSESSSSSGSSSSNSHFSLTSPLFHHNSLDARDTSGSSDAIMKRNTPEWMMQVCQFVIRDLDQYGICVIDNFLGVERGDLVLQSVQAMYDSGVFREGETVSNKPKITGNIRGDKIAWVDGSEPHCQPISYLIRMVDSVVMNASRLNNNGKLGQHQISDRTKGMVACYPGSGTHYVKHVDNPNRDGRCVTSIYYLNRDWNVKKDGGLLRIFPQGWTNQVADIEPIFDRVVFFWSDRRNPHEVQPAFRTRYAITLWYFDSKEREEARLRQRTAYGAQTTTAE